MTHPPARGRHSIRLDGYDYTQPGAYFVTIVTADRVNRFGVIAGGEMRLNAMGQMVEREWMRLPARFAGLAVDAFVVMPNHVHGVLIIGGSGGGDGDAERPHVDPGSLGAIVRAFKSATTLRYHHARGTDPGPLWQRNYFEHIARGPGDLERIRAYILANPTNWAEDRVYSDRGCF